MGQARNIWQTLSEIINLLIQLGTSYRFLIMFGGPGRGPGSFKLYFWVCMGAGFIGWKNMNETNRKGEWPWQKFWRHYQAGNFGKLWKERGREPRYRQPRQIKDLKKDDD